MKRIIDSTLVILSLMLIFGCKESKVGQGNPTKDSMSIDTDSVISGKVFTKQDIASEDTLNAVIRTQSPKSKDFDFEVFIMRGEKIVQIIPFSYPKDDTFDPNGGRTSCPERAHRLYLDRHKAEASILSARESPRTRRPPKSAAPHRAALASSGQ